MHIFPLPAPRAETPPAFADKAGARAWLAAQPQADPLRLLTAVTGQLQALDASAAAPAQLAPLIGVLRVAVVPIVLAIEPRYTRKALPLPEGDQALFDATLALWQALALADLRLAERLPGAAAGPSLLRAAMAIRHAQHACFLAAQAVPPGLDQGLLATLHLASARQTLETALPDPDFSDLPESSVTAELIWVCLLRALDPWHWSAVQLTVANRALRRWRSLVRFQSLPSEDPRAPQISLARLFPEYLIEGVPAWIDARPVWRKLKKRQEALAAGESPEALKLGNELSGTACQRLLDDMANGLKPLAPPPATGESRDCPLIFGGEHAYALCRERILNKSAADIHRQAIAHQRMEIFGFDELSRLPGEKPKLHIPAEHWQQSGERVSRAAEAGQRRTSPCLVAGRDAQGRPQLGVLHALKATPAGLQGRLAWYGGRVQASHVEGAAKHGQPVPKYPVFLIQTGGEWSLVAPPGAGLAPGMALRFGDDDLPGVDLQSVQERGSDFVRFACQPR